MSNPAISRDEVHSLAEACAESADTFRSTAQRLLKNQKSLTNFMQKNMVHLAPETREVVLYMYAVSLRIFEQKGGMGLTRYTNRKGSPLTNYQKYDIPDRLTDIIILGNGNLIFGQK